MIRVRSNRATGSCFLQLRIPMELVTLSETYRDFYAPTYTVRVAGQNLMRDLVVAVCQVEVDLMLGAASRFTFTLTDCYSAKAQEFQTGRGVNLLTLISFGAEVEIYMGYRDDKST